MTAHAARVTGVVGDDLVERAATDPAAATAAIDAIAGQRHTLAVLRREHLGSPDDELALSHLGRALQRLAESLRLTGEYAEALALQDEALAVWQALDRPKAAHLVALRRALTLHRLGRGDDAYAAFDALAARAGADEELTIYDDLAAELRARCLFADGRLDDALEAAERALALRLTAGRAAHQLDATRATIARIRARLCAQRGPVSHRATKL